MCIPHLDDVHSPATSYHYEMRSIYIHFAISLPRVPIQCTGSPLSKLVWYLMVSKLTYSLGWMNTCMQVVLSRMNERSLAFVKMCGEEEMKTCALSVGMVSTLSGNQLWAASPPWPHAVCGNTAACLEKGIFLPSVSCSVSGSSTGASASKERNIPSTPAHSIRKG